MAMVVKNNMGATKTLNSLNKSNKKLGKAFSKVATGMKITGAGDDPSQYAISEKMRELVRSLEQDDQNVQNGSSLFRIAEGGIDNVIDELRNLKELAINAANDTNTDDDRLTIQKELEQRMENINSIANETTYNGIHLLNDNYKKMVVVGTKDVEHTEIIGYNTRQITYTKPTATKVRQRDGGVAIRENNNNSALASNFTAVDQSISTLSNPRSGRSIQCDVGFVSGNWNWERAMSDTGVTGLTYVQYGYYYSSYKPNQVGVSMDFTFDDANPTIQDLNGEGFSILCGACYQYINISFDANRANADSTFTRSPTDSQRSDYVIGISDLTTVDDDALSRAIFNGINTSNNGYNSLNINNDTGDAVNVQLDTRHDVRVALNPYYDANDSSKGTQYIFLKQSGLDMDFIGSGTMIGIDSPTSIDGNEITIYVDVNTTETINEPIYRHYSVEEEIYAPEGKPLVIHHGPKANQSTHFFIGDMRTKFLGADEIYIDDATLSIDERIVNQADRDRYYALSYDKDLQEDWITTLKEANKKSLDDIDVITRKNANIAIKVIEEAIDDAVNEATTMGSYLQRLEFTDKNIVVMGENVQAAESTIRDADMAKEMTEYTKYNVLQQAAQSMLAQANQNASAVLSLLQ